MANERKAAPRPQQMPRGARMPGQKLDMKVLKRTLSYLSGYKVRVAIAIVCLVISSGASVLASMALGWLIDDYITPMMQTGFEPVTLLLYLLKLAALFLSGIIAAFISNRIFVRISQGIMKDVRNDMFRHMQTLPIGYFDSHTHGELMSHYTNDTDTLRQMLSQTLPQIVSAVITLTVSFITMLMTSVWLLLFVLVFVFGMILITGRIGATAGKFFVKQQQTLAEMNGYIEEMINGQRVVKVFNHEGAAIDGFDQRNEKLFREMKTANGVAQTMGPAMNNLGYIMYALLAVIGALFVANNIPNVTPAGTAALTVGSVVTFLQLSRSFSQTVSNVAQQANTVVMAMAGAKRIFDLIDEKSEEDDGKVTLVNVKEENGKLTEVQEKTHIWAWKVPEADGSFRLVRLKGDVRLKDVDFSYVPDKQILHDITLYAEPGQKVAFVGSTGAGKTTITNLINRFYDIQDGTITYDGIPIMQISKNALRSSLGIVLQDVNLFTGTIRENIRYGKLTASDDEVIAAAKLANAHDFIERLPEGYDTVIDGSGSQLSQGQRQLISIARAAIADPPVMILDEATSSIDTRTEAIVQRGMDALMHGRTVFVIAHRLSTVQNSDVIMVLEHGRIIERGSHDELIEERGKYYQLYTGAFELE